MSGCYLSYEPKLEALLRVFRVALKLAESTEALLKFKLFLEPDFYYCFIYSVAYRVSLEKELGSTKFDDLLW